MVHVFDPNTWMVAHLCELEVILDYTRVPGQSALHVRLSPKKKKDDSERTIQTHIYSTLHAHTCTHAHIYTAYTHSCAFMYLCTYM